MDNKGQVLLITLLVFSVAMTVALSLIGRTTTDTAISSQVEESARAFSAAEAGIEQALQSGVGSAGAQSITTGVTYSTDVQTIGGSSATYQFTKKAQRGVAQTVWLVNHKPDGTVNEQVTYASRTFDVCWSAEGITPAVEVSIYYKESSDGSYRVIRGAYDPQSTRRGSNKFAPVDFSVGGCGNGTGTTFRQPVDVSVLNGTVDPTTDILIMARIKPVYSDTQLAINPAVGMPLPVQGYRVESTGQTGSGVTRKVVVFQQFRAPLGIFDYAIYSQGDFSH